MTSPGRPRYLLVETPHGFDLRLRSELAADDVVLDTWTDSYGWTTDAKGELVPPDPETLVIW